jgi:LysM repeat protein
MTHRICGMVMAICLLACAGLSRGQQLLYVPKPIETDEKIQKNDGILVQEVSIKKGDTLYGISRSFSGHGTYYPQILLFNDIKDPNKIYPGNVLKIPVSRKGEAVQAANPKLSKRPATVPLSGQPVDAPVTALKMDETVGEKKREAGSKATTSAAKQKQPVTAAAANPEQKLYERAIKAYRKNDYTVALELFDRFLADHPSSALAADASLYKAECYLKLSNQ